MPGLNDVTSCAILKLMSVERVDFGAVALAAATRDLTAPLVLLRQLSFELDELALPAEAADTLARMQLTIDRTLAITDQLNWAGESTNVNLEPVQLAGLCYELSRDLAPLGHELNCQLDFELPRRRHPVVAVGNYRALKEMVANFLTDALRYSADQVDGRRIVRLRVANRPGEAAIQISDTGPAVNLTESLKRMRQLDTVNPTATRPLMGSLNLLMADRLLRAMNGHLEVHNGRRGGVTIRACLPASHQLSLLGDK